MPSKQKKRRKNLTAASAGAPGPVSSSSNFSRSGPMAQPYAATAGLLVNGHADAAYHPAFSSFSAPPMTPTFTLPGLTSFVPPMNGQYQTSVQTPLTPHFPQVPGLLTSGNSDLEKLERLKREILEGQNPIYKAVPQPDFLASLYLGRSSQAQSAVPAHPEQVAVQTPPSQAADSAQKPEDDGKSPEVDQPAAAVEEGKTDKVDMAESAKVVAETSSVPYTPVADSQVTPPPQNARGAIILDEIARFRASATSQPAAPHASAASSNATGSLDPLRHHFQQDNKPSVRAISDYKITGHSGSNGSSVDSSRRPDSFVSDGSRRPSEYWDSKNYGSRFDHESNVEREVRDRDRHDLPDQRYSDSRYENNSPRDRQPPFSATGGQHSQDYRHSDERVESRSPVVPSHISETVRSLTERLANGVGNDSISMRTGATSAAEVPAHYPPAGSPVSAVGLPSSLGMSSDFHARSVSGDEHHHPVHDEHSHAFANDRSRQPPRDDRPLHYPPSTLDRSPMNSAPHALLSPKTLRGRATPLEERIGLKVPLEERISSPSSEAKARALQERISDPQPHVGYDRPLPPPAFNNSTQTASRDTRPLSARPARPTDDNNLIISSTSVHTQGRHDERVHQRAPSYGTYPHEAPDPSLRPPSITSYNHNELQDRRPDFRGHEKEPIVVYERPTYRERNGSPQDERSRPTIESREWRERERAVYPPPPPSRATHSTPEIERYASHPPDVREWTPNDRGYRAPETNWDAQRTPPPPREGDRSRYPDVRGEYDRCPPAGAAPPPRSWDRSEPPTARPRPAPEVFPPPPTHERERYPPPPPEYYDNPRVRARSPSPTRRGGPLVDDLRPAKRVRDEGSFYDDRRSMAYPGPGYASRPPSPPPPPVSAGGYYEGGRAAYPPPREAHPPAYVTRGEDFYAHRPGDAMSLPPRNGPPTSYPNRAIYSRPDRDDRRYNMPPPRTA